MLGKYIYFKQARLYVLLTVKYFKAINYFSMKMVQSLLSQEEYNWNKLLSFLNLFKSWKVITDCVKKLIMQLHFSPLIYSQVSMCSKKPVQ